MHSSSAYDRFTAVLDDVEGSLDRFLASIDSLTAGDLVEALDCYALLMVRLDALIYELSSPFGRPGGRRTWH
ncbi:hypothetical protein [Mycobacterium sp. E3247]|uniref:hypothetical protein n=1 Tax=Mycobacterium sp. E3247 TaxID=1856864 RepID=UPI0007FF505D|nr:hypothetical protein [Mycobacterium sp. E3247]OBH15077.1 hypothetical protein A9X04_13315 [Mycobacterium sp. E3247]